MSWDPSSVAVEPLAMAATSILTTSPTLGMVLTEMPIHDYQPGLAVVLLATAATTTPVTSLTARDTVEIQGDMATGQGRLPHRNPNLRGCLGILHLHSIANSVWELFSFHCSYWVLDGVVSSSFTLFVFGYFHFRFGSLSTVAFQRVK